jgi:hypothetical protein
LYDCFSFTVICYLYCINNAYANTILAEISFILSQNPVYLVTNEYTSGDRLAEKKAKGERRKVKGEDFGRFPRTSGRAIRLYGFRP